MNVIETELPGVLLFQPKLFGDERGFFMETYRKDIFAQHGVDLEFVQDNHSGSLQNTVRGLHYQLRRPQAKLCRVTVGEVLDVVVDIRRGSPTFGKHIAVVLSAQNRYKLFVPRGFAHGFSVLSERAEFQYKCDDYYDPASERGILWNDPELGIDWKITGEPLLSHKDSLLPRLAEMPADQLPVYSQR